MTTLQTPLGIVEHQAIVCALPEFSEGQDVVEVPQPYFLRSSKAPCQQVISMNLQLLLTEYRTRIQSSPIVLLPEEKATEDRFSIHHSTNLNLSVTSLLCFHQRTIVSKL